jgi:hypothetical protein
MLTLVAAILGSGIALLDGSIVNVALPAIEDELGGGLAGQQWVVNAYLLTLGSLILLGGSLSDVYGERWIFAIGVASFGIASVLCTLAPTIETLVAARALQGMTSALLTPASLALIATTFDEKERGAAIGTWTAWGGPLAVVQGAGDRLHVARFAADTDVCVDPVGNDHHRAACARGEPRRDTPEETARRPPAGADHDHFGVLLFADRHELRRRIGTNLASEPNAPEAFAIGQVHKQPSPGGQPLAIVLVPQEVSSTNCCRFHDVDEHEV